MSNNTEFDLVMIGHLAKDKLVVDGKAEMALGGAVYYGGVALSRQNFSVAVVTRLHPDDYDLLDELRHENIAVFASPAGETSGIENIYDSADMERRICKPLGFAGPFQKEEIPEVQAPIYVAAGIIAGEIDLPLLRKIAGRGPVGLDVQGFVRVMDGNDLVFRPWLEMEEGLSHVTYLKLDRAEAELLTGLSDLEAAARKLADYGPQEVVVTQSSGVTVYANGRIYSAPFISRSLRGRTGRGDTCFSTYLAQRLSLAPQEAVRIAAAVTSLKQEQPGPWRGTINELQERLREMNRD